MRYMVWLLCVLAGLSSAALPENHRSSHRPRLNRERLIPSRTTAAPTTPSTTTTSSTAAPTEIAEASTAAPVVSTAAPTEEHKQVDHQQISQQVLAQQHQQQIALDALKAAAPPQVTTYRPFSSQYQTAPDSDLQQLIALMQQHQGGGQYNIFSPPPFGPQASFAPSGSGGGSNFYNQQGGSFYSQPGSGFGQQGGGFSPQGGGFSPQGGGYNPQGGFAPQGGGFAPQGYQQGGGYSPQISAGYGQQVYQPQPSYAPQQSNPQQFNFQGPSYGAPLPYNPPRTPTYIFKNGKYEIESNPDKIQFSPQPIQAATPLPASDGGSSEVSQIVSPSLSTAEVHAPTAQPEQVGVQYVVQQQEAVQSPIYAQPQQVFAQPQSQQFVQPQQQQQYVQQTQHFVQPQQAPQQVYVQQPQQYAQPQQQFVQPQQQFVQPQQSVVYTQAPPTFIQHVNRPESAAQPAFPSQIVQQTPEQVQPSSQPASYQEQAPVQSANPSSVSSTFSRLKYTPVHRG